MAEIVLLAFPGLIAVTIYRWFSRSRSRAGWDYLVQTGLSGAAAYLLAYAVPRGFCALTELGLIFEGRGSGLIQQNCFAEFRLPGIAGDSPGLDTTTYFAAFPVAALLGYVAASLLHSVWFRRLSARIGMRHAPGEVDALTALSRLSSPVIVSTDTAQVYIGLIQKVTTDPDEELKLVVLEVFASGARIRVQDSGQEKHRARYNYALQFNPDRSTLLFLDFRNIVGVGEFHVQDFLDTMASGYTEIDPQMLIVLLRRIIRAGRDIRGEARQFVDEQEEQSQG